MVRSRFASTLVLSVAILLSGCAATGPQTPEEAVAEYVAAVNDRDRAALVALSAPAYDPQRFADYVLERAPEGPVTAAAVTILPASVPEVTAARIRWEHGGVPADGQLGLVTHDGRWFILIPGADLEPAPGPRSTPSMSVTGR